MHVPVVKQHCAQMEGFAFSHINMNKIPVFVIKSIDVTDMTEVWVK